MPVAEEKLNLPRTGESGKWESHSAGVVLPRGAEYVQTTADYNCPQHGLENYQEGTSGHWFKFVRAVHDPEKNVVTCECSYQVHDKDSYVVFKVDYRPADNAP